MIKQFTVLADGQSSRDQIRAAVSKTLKALGAIDPRVLITQTHRSEWEVIIATDENLILETQKVDDEKHQTD